MITAIVFLVAVLSSAYVIGCLCAKLLVQGTQEIPLVWSQKKKRLILDAALLAMFAWIYLLTYGF